MKQQPVRKWLMLMFLCIFFISSTQGKISPPSTINHIYSPLDLQYYDISASRGPYIEKMDSSFSQSRKPVIFYEEDDETEKVSYNTNPWPRRIRKAFIRKVYTIFTTQILSTVLITAFIISNPQVAYMLQRNYLAISLTTFALSMASVSALLLIPNLRHQSPMNYILLGLFTLMQSISVGSFSSQYDTTLVCQGSLHTLSALLAITLYSFQPNPQFDLTTAGSTLLAATSVLLIGSILGSFFHMPLMNNIISGLFAVVFAAYIAHDTQMIVGGRNKKKSYSPNEYILAALSLYQDVIALFIQILKILGELDSENKKRKRNE
mmetsp:Transcript_4817/g.6647  ORF Transcript_4817/g.6647 Transcript_4817/m.6647 type:complete len:321 (-) Transcript_4817:260-1222(-)